MTNITTLSYNIQVLFNNVNVLTNKLTEVENQILKLQSFVVESTPPPPQPAALVEPPKVDLTPLENTIQTLQSRIDLFEKQITELKLASMQAAREIPIAPIAPIAPSTATSAVPQPSVVSDNILEELAAPSNAVSDVASKVDDDILLSMTQTDNASSVAKPKGGRKKKSN
jgi:uncharacterized coiled-coil protein SlyX